MKLFSHPSPSSLILAAMLCSFPRAGIAQTTSGDQSWTSTNQQGSPDGNINPTRTRASHTETSDRKSDSTSVERVGPDGSYIPYSDTEKETVRVNETTSRTIERTYGRDPDGNRTLIQERQEETRSLPGGEQQVTRTLSNPDGNGKLQVIQRESEDSKQISPGVRVTNSTLFTPDIEGRFSPAIRSEKRETTSNEGTVESRKSTLLKDGTGQWKLSEVRESTSKPDGVTPAPKRSA